MSKKHPDLPIFDAPDWESYLPRPMGSKPAIRRLKVRGTDRPRHGHTIPSKSRPRLKPGKRIILKSSATNDFAGVHVLEEIGETLPPTWPKVGKGLYSKLLPDSEDKEFLLDGNDEEAFSHFMVDSMGHQVVEPT